MRLSSFVAALWAAPLVMAAPFTIVNLGDAGFDTEAMAVNGSGQAAVTSYAPGVEWVAAGINEAGWVVGTTFTQTGAQAMLHYDGQAWAVANFGGDSYGYDVNGAGQAVGTAGNRAYVAKDGSVTWLSHPMGTMFDAANAINESGAVAGTLVDEWGIERGYVWSNGQTRWTGTLGGMRSRATNLNDAGQVTGSAETGGGESGGGWMHAFLAGEGYITDLGTLGGLASYAYGINNAGEVVGYSWREDGTMAAFLYTNGVMLDLSTLVEGLEGWTLATAYGINDGGQIVGTGFYNGRRTAYRLDPVVVSARLEAPLGLAEETETPEPSTGVLIVMGVALIVLARRLGDTRKSD
ncbi:MAG: PEP-CTERM sorting domain-containing protein [Bryobacterales bacterium]|nr:PEP-CTERM sorting domain-containing protein [Bryobacterales bacterium]